MDYEVYCISHKRSQNVVKIQETCGENLTWIVGKDDLPSYFEAGAKNVAVGGGLCESRNMALERAFANEKICIQISDDLKRIWWIEDKESKKEISFSSAVHELLFDLNQFRAKLAGVAPTSNAYFFNKEHHFTQFVVGDMIAVAPCPLRFDTSLKLKEDYDFTVQHLIKYGLVVRNNRIAPEFLHRTNKGGAVDYRTAGREQEAIQYLTTKWPGWFRPNPRRPNEILLANRS